MNQAQRRVAPEGDPVQGVLLPRLVEEGLVHHQRGQGAQAETCYRRALALEPNDPDALHFLGVLRHQGGRSADAVGLIGRAASIKPQDATVFNNLGVALEALGRAGEAADAYERAVTIEPDYAEAWNNRGNALLGLGRFDAALASYDHALAARSGYAEAFNNRGVALHRLKRFAEAMASFDCALKARANYPEAFNNRGSALLALGDAARAVESFDRALALDGRYAEALFNRGNALLELNRHQAATASYDRALEIKPGYQKALNNRGNALKDQGRLDEAETSYRRALAVRFNPDFYSNLLFARQYMDRYTDAGLRDAAREYGASLGVDASPRNFSNDRVQNRRLRIGYVSGDFSSHPVGFFLASVLDAHNHEAVEVFCYSNHARTDRMTERLGAAADHWRTIVDLPDVEASNLIQRDRIDILVDLAGHTDRNRLPLFSRRPAPVQASWIGYPGTTGVSAIDYVIMDEHSVLPGEESHYTEAVVRLPYGRLCYSPPAHAPEPVDPPSSRGNAITFGSFNNIAKIGPKVIEVWASILRAVPESRLLLKWKVLDDDATRRRLITAFAAAGVGPHRLAFQRSSHHAEMMAQYGEVDIALDPFPFGGGLTTCEAFWMGVPVVTLSGERATSRQVLAAFHDLGLGDLVTSLPAEYVERAKELAHDPARLISIRRSLRTRMATSPICDGRRFAAAVEWSFGGMWRRWCRGEAPAPFDVPRVCEPGGPASKTLNEGDRRAGTINGGQ